MKVSDITVNYIDHCGSDLSVVDAARVSFNKVSEFVNGELSSADVKLINYLARHKHTSPFNHCFLTVRVKAPIFVARQLVKHKFMPYNETSRRYVTDEPEFYLPDVWRKLAENVKQGSSNIELEKPLLSGKCLYCNGSLPYKRTKYCCDKHQAASWREANKFKNKFSRWKASAKANGHVFNITEDDLDWPKHCPYLDTELNYDSDSLADNIASLDKIVPEKGYISGNVQIISLLANKMKSSATKEQILTFARNSSMVHGGIFMGQAHSYEDYLQKCSETYNSMIEQGYCAEQARMFLPQSLMTEWVWSGTLGAFCDMLKLRLDSHTQLETRVVAEKVSDIVKNYFPVSHKALLENKGSQ